MFLKKMELGSLKANCYIIANSDTKYAAIIDPGDAIDKIINTIEENNLKVKYIILTHGHCDHIGAAEELKNITNAPIYVHKNDLALLEDKNKNYSAMIGRKVVEFSTDNFLEDGDILKLGNLQLEILHTPGHTQGGICIYVDDIVFTGDTLFANSIGRTDFVGGDYNQIIDSINTKLMVLSDYVRVLPGHGPESNIGVERSTNPFINKKYI